MTKRLDYYLALNSPWAYLGSRRLEALVDRYRPALTVQPIDIGAVFDETGGLPLARRSKQRQAYRLHELARWRDHLAVPLVLQPRSFPFDERRAALMVWTLADRPHEALRLANAIQAMLWAEDRDMADPTVLVDAARKAGLDGAALLARVDREQAGLEARRTKATKAGVARGLFGAPGYFVGDELFWGQDRIEFVERALAR